jgi:hypothetical protein
MNRVVAACGALAVGLIASAAVHAFRLGVVRFDAAGYLGVDVSALEGLAGSATPAQVSRVPSSPEKTLVATAPDVRADVDTIEFRVVAAPPKPKKTPAQKPAAPDRRDEAAVVEVVPVVPDLIVIPDMPGMSQEECDAIRREIDAAMKSAKISSMTRRFVIRTLDANDLPGVDWVRFEGGF